MLIINMEKLEKEKSLYIKTCKECGKKYKVGNSSGHIYRQHNHGKNASFYGKKLHKELNF